MTMNTPSDIKLWDKDYLLEQIGGSEPILMQLVDMFLGDVPNQLAALSAEIENNDFESVLSSAHSIKGSALNLGAFQFGQVGAEMEQAAKDNDAAFLNENLSRLTAAYEAVAEVFSDFKAQQS